MKQVLSQTQSSLIMASLASQFVWGIPSPPSKACQPTHPAFRWVLGIQTPVLKVAQQLGGRGTGQGGGEHLLRSISLPSSCILGNAHLGSGFLPGAVGAGPCESPVDTFSHRMPGLSLLPLPFSVALS